MGLPTLPSRRQIDRLRPIMDGANMKRRSLRAMLLATAALVGVLVPAQPREPGTAAVVYEGDLVDGARSGQGVLIYPDGTRYEGGFEEGRRHGEGTLRLPTGDVYAGEFRADAMTGRGRFEWADGDVYEGDFIDGERTGRGAYLWRNGARYRGGLVSGTPHGEGVYEYPDGTVYRGAFDNGIKAGLGELLADDTRYFGWFAEDQTHGLGHYRWRDGTLYKGHFAFGRQDGPGVKETPGGELSFEVWDAGRLVAATTVSAIERCVLVIDDVPWMFDGDSCINGLAHGRGRAVRLDGAAYIEDGRFVLGRLAAGETTSLALAESLALEAGPRE